MNVAQRLKKAVEARGVKLSAISRATGIPVDSISRSFLGKRKMLADEALTICRFLRVKFPELELFDTEERADAVASNLRQFEILMRTTPADTLCKINSALTGREDPEESVVAHARIRAELFSEAIDLLEASHADTSGGRSGNEGSA